MESFRTRDWDWCYPLTLLDHVSRKGLGLQALDATDGYGVRVVFERAFREAGLPLAILTDNGPPLVAPRGLRGLSKLSVWWIRLGIRPLCTEPSSPEQNGAHERFHRTLKAETGAPVAGSRIVSTCHPCPRPYTREKTGTSGRELCRRFGISRSTSYKGLERFCTSTARSFLGPRWDRC